MFALNAIPPWIRADGFPPRPLTSDYGYYKRGKFIACSREELEQRCAKGGPGAIQLVWHPDTTTLVTLNEVPFLHEALFRRANRFMWGQILISLAACLVFGSLYAIYRFGITPGIFKFLVYKLVGTPEEVPHELFLCLFIGLGAAPLLQSLHGLRQLRHYSSAGVQAAIPLARFFTWVGIQQRPFTLFASLLIVVVTVVQASVGMDRAIGNAALFIPAIQDGEWWRLFTGPMMHGGWIHLLCNLSAMLIIGKFCETLTGRGATAFVLFASTMVGAVSSYFFLPSVEIPSVGLSGGIMGLIGFLFILGLRRRDLVPYRLTHAVALSIVLVAGMGVYAADMIDNAGHAGGLICGLALGFWLCKKSGKEVPIEMPDWVLSVGATSAVILWASAIGAIWVIIS